MSFIGQIVGGIGGLLLGSWLVFGLQLFGSEPGWVLLLIPILGFGGAIAGSRVGMRAGRR